MLRTACLFAVLTGTASLVATAETVRVVSDTASERLIERIAGELTETEPAETVFEARRQARQAASRAQAYLNSRGYFDAEVSHSVESGPPPRAAIKVEPGPRYRIAETSRRIIGGEISPEDEARLARAMTIEPGDFAIADKVVSQEAGLLAVLRSLGYADARALKRRISGDQETDTITVVYRLRPGPRVRFGEVVFDDGVRTRQPYLNRLIPFEEGEVFSPDKLSEFNGRLANTRLYSVSSAHLDEAASETETGTDDVRDVIVTLTERDRYTVTAGASVSTSEGPGLTASLTRRNATRRGDTLTARTTLAAQQRAVGVDWRIPNAIAFDKGLVFSANGIRDETDAFDREAVTLSGSYEVRHSKAFAYSLGVASEVTSETDAFGQRDLQILS
ncbi:MAG: POTRA domain-containing protein, partial [Pseudomonadota bacterium]